MKAEQLRKSILQLAIQGKLVPQDPADEPASVLLERIRAEKQRLIKEGKIKKDKGDSVIFKGDDNCYYEKTGSEVKNITDEIPFDIPDTWCWVRLGNVLEIARGGSPRPIKEYLTTDNTGVNWIKIGDTEKGGKYINSTKEKIKQSGISKSRFVHKGDFLLTNSMSFGRPYILNIDGCIHDGWLVFSDTSNVYFKDFLYYVLSSSFANKQFIGKVSGAVVKNLNSDKVADSLFPLPPFAEQERIVAKIEKFEPLIAEYDKLEQQATKLDDEIYDKLKKSILQYAIQGKLVPQNSNDEPAAVLLERIRAEKKAQLGKKYVESYIYKGDDNCYYEKVGKNEPVLIENLPFDIPDSWCWARLKDIVTNHGQKIPDKTFSYIDIGSIDNKMQCLNSIENFVSPENAPSRARKIVEYGDILYATVRPYLHNMAIIDKTFSHEPIASTGFAVLSCKNGLSNKYLFFYLLSPIFDLYANSNENAKGVAYPAINDEKLYNALIAIPPYNEQICICNQIEIMLGKLKDEN